jgi:uncharacterized protein (DUF885 family)
MMKPKSCSIRRSCHRAGRQALGCLIGQREILRLRERAQAELGAAYDVRDFHSAVLDHGALPLTVLRRVVEEWVRARQSVQV